MSDSNLNVLQFLDVLRRSRLVTEEQLDTAVRNCTQHGKRTAEVTEIANQLVTAGWITGWQQRNLLQNKSRGFFLAGYRLLEHLGTGGMSSVFLARHPLIDRKVAIKVLPASKVGDRSFLDRFEREARAMSRLSHRNVVRVYDIDEHEGTHFMVMEYVAGRDLKAIVKKQGALPLHVAADYVAQAAIGLQHAHDRGLVHRDIKPANLIVDERGTVKVLDLGLARGVDDDEMASLTIAYAENVMGTADYLAPEQARDAHSANQQSDIYSLGCTFYFLLCGNAPFTEGTIAERILKHQSESPTDVRAHRQDCPHAVADVCMRMLAKEPADRPQSMREVANPLQLWLKSMDKSSRHAVIETGSLFRLLDSVRFSNPSEQQPQDAETLDRESAPTSKQLSRRQSLTLIWAVIALCAVVCIGLLAFVLSQDRIGTQE